MSTEITNPFSFFTDKAGDALDQGFVYIGVNGSDPQTSPVACYWDAALTQAAAQPLRTVAGYIVNPASGNSKAHVYTSNAFSIRVRDRNGAQVDYVVTQESLAADLASPSGSNLVGFIQTGTGAIASSVQTRLRQVGLRPEDYVAGTPSDWASAFQLCLNEAKAKKMPIYLDGAKAYTMGSNGWAGLAIDAGHVDIYGNGATIKLLFQPTNSVFGGTNPAYSTTFRFTNTTGIRIDNVRIDFNGIISNAWAFQTCSDIIISGAGPINGVADLSSSFVWALGCVGFTAQNTNCPAPLGFAFRMGHYNTNADQVTDVWLVNNKASGLYADFLAAVANNVYCIGNEIDGCYSGFVLSGYANGAVNIGCENVFITNNRVKGYVGAALQADQVWVSGAPVRNKNVIFEGNLLEGVAATTSAVYIYGLDNFCLRGNHSSGVIRFCSMLDVTQGIVSQNRIKCNEQGITVITSPDAAGYASGAADISITANLLEMTAGNGIEIGPAGTYQANRVSIKDNTVRGGAYGCSVQSTGHASLEIIDNTFTGNTFDVRCDTQNAYIDGNTYTTDGSGTFGEWVLAALTAGAANLAGRTSYLASYGSAQTITSFTGMVIGREYRIRATNGNTTIQNGGTIALKGGINAPLAAGNMITLALGTDTIVREKCRNF